MTASTRTSILWQIEHAPDVAFDRRNRVENVTQKEAVALVHSGRASASIRSLSAGCSSRSVHKSTFTPNASPISSCRPMMPSRDVPDGRSTRRSRSLPSLSRPLAAEPKTRTLRAPRAVARLMTVSRKAASASEGRISAFSQLSRKCASRCPTKLELIVNLKTAKALGIWIPQSVLVRATKVV